LKKKTSKQYWRHEKITGFNRRGKESSGFASQTFNLRFKNEGRKKKGEGEPRREKKWGVENWGECGEKKVNNP